MASPAGSRSVTHNKINFSFLLRLQSSRLIFRFQRRGRNDHARWSNGMLLSETGLSGRGWT